MQVTITIDDAVLPNVTAERLAYNETPATHDAQGNPLPPNSTNPVVETNNAFIDLQVKHLVRGWVKKHGLLPPPPPPPDPNAWHVVTRKQGLKALARADLAPVSMPAPIYEVDIQAKITAMPETTAAERLAKYDMQTEFDNAPTWRRGNPFFENMVAALGITATQRDDLLKLAFTFLD